MHICIETSLLRLRDSPLRSRDSLLRLGEVSIPDHVLQHWRAPRYRVSVTASQPWVKSPKVHATESTDPQNQAEVNTSTAAYTESLVPISHCRSHAASALFMVNGHNAGLTRHWVAEIGLQA